jgi:serine/threonine protein kinase
VWALGATLYATVEGRLPYPDQNNAIALLTQIASEPPPPPTRAGFLADAIGRMMDPDPSTRWTMADAAHTLHRLHEQHAAKSSGLGTVSLGAPLVEAEPDEGPTEPESARIAPVLADPDLPPARTEERRGAGRRATVVAVAVALVILAGVGAMLLNDRDEDPSAADEPTSASTDSGQSNDQDSSSPDDPVATGGTDGASGAATTFVEDYYSNLPGDTRTAWDLLSPSMQDEVGGYGNYSGFWRTISEVRTGRTTLVEEDVVDVEVIYTSDGGTERETRRLRLEKNGDSFLITGDKVV